MKIWDKFFPNHALKRKTAELKIAETEFKQKELKVRSQLADNFLNYSQSGASKRKIAFRNSYDYVNSVDEDIGDNKETLMARSRQLFMGNAISRGAIEKLKTNIVGKGLYLKSKINNKVLKLSRAEVNRIQNEIHTLWEIWSESTECDIRSENNFYQLQALALMTHLIDGECFTLLPFKERKNEIFLLKIRFIDSWRCKSEESNDLIRDGVEVDKDGRPIAYYFENPGEEPLKIKRFSDKGRRNIIVLMDKERINQRRGVPYLSPVIEILAQLTKFTEAELMNAVVSAMFTIFIKEDKQIESTGKINGIPIENNNKDFPDEKELSMGYGNILHLEPGQGIEFANPGRPNDKFEKFVTAMCKQIGAALGIPFEVLLSSFNASYSASRASLLEVWKMYMVRRKNMADNFCQPIFEEFMDEVVGRGFIDLPGYFENPLIRKAYLKAEWYGQAQGQIDPLKEVKSSVMKIQNGLSTVSRESRELNGSDWDENFEQRSIENKKMKELGINGKQIL